MGHEQLAPSLALAEFAPIEADPQLELEALYQEPIPMDLASDEDPMEVEFEEEPEMEPEEEPEEESEEEPEKEPEEEEPIDIPDESRDEDNPIEINAESEFLEYQSNSDENDFEWTPSRVSRG